MAASRALAAALAVLAAGCVQKPSLTEAQVKALSREGAYLTGQVVSLRRETVLDEGGLASAVGASRHGELVAFTALAGNDATLTAVDLRGGPRRLWTARVNAGRLELEAVEVAPDGSFIATAGRDGFVRAFRARTGVPGAALGLGRPLTSVALSPDGAHLAVGTASGRVVVTSFPGLEILASAELHRGQEVRGLAYRDDGAIVSGGWDRSVVISRQEGGDLREERRRLLVQYVNDVHVASGTVAVALSAQPADRARAMDGEQDVTLEDPAPANAAVLLDGTTLEELLRPVHHRGPVSTVALAPDSLVLVSGGWDGRVLVGQRDERPPLEDRLGGPIRRMRLTRDARYLVVAAWAPPAPEGSPPRPSVTVLELVRAAPEVVRER